MALDRTVAASRLGPWGPLLASSRTGFAPKRGGGAAALAAAALAAAAFAAAASGAAFARAACRRAGGGRMFLRHGCAPARRRLPFLPFLFSSFCRPLP